MIQVETRTQIQSWSWFWQRHQQMVVCAAEKRERLVDANGGTLVRTLEEQPMNLAPPRGFERQKNLWLRYLKRRPIDDFQLICTRRWLRRLGPPVSFCEQIPEWTAIMNFTSVPQGRQILTWSDRGHCPPTSKLMRRLDLKRDMVPGKPVIPEGDLVIGFQADELLRLLRSAMDHVISLSQQLGSWRGDAVGRFKPAQRWFHPKQQEVRSPQWWALGLDSANNVLHCVAPHPAPAQYRSFQLSQPLYRYVPEMTFGSIRSSLIIKDIQYVMPQAFLNLGP